MRHSEAERVLRTAGERCGIRFTMSHWPVGAAAVAVAGGPLPGETRAAGRQADAVLLGAVGAPALEHAPRHPKPEAGLLPLLPLPAGYANFRPGAVLSSPAD